MIAPVGVGRMHLGIYLGRVVEEQVEDIMAFMVMGSDQFGIDRHVVGHERVGDDALLEAKVFG